MFKQPIEHTREYVCVCVEREREYLQQKGKEQIVHNAHGTHTRIYVYSLQKKINNKTTYTIQQKN